MYIQQCLEVTKWTEYFSSITTYIARVNMSFTSWNAPNVRHNMLENQKLNSILDSITTERMYGNQMLYDQVQVMKTILVTLVWKNYLAFAFKNHDSHRMYMKNTKADLSEHTRFWYLCFGLKWSKTVLFVKKWCKMALF